MMVRPLPAAGALIGPLEGRLARRGVAPQGAGSAATAFLLGAGLPLPRRILAHSHWTLDRAKMSKSRGNVVDPIDRLGWYGADRLRYYLLKEGRIQNDADYADERVAAVVNELGNTLGNLQLRVDVARRVARAVRLVEVVARQVQLIDLLALVVLPASARGAV